MSNKIERSKSGVPIIGYEQVDTQWCAPNFGEEGHIEKMDEHIERYIGNIEMVYHEVVSDIIHLDINYIKPNNEQNYHTFITSGVSILPMTPMKGAENDTYIELMICLPNEWIVSEESFKLDEYYWPIRFLKMLGRFPHVYKTWLGFAHTIPNGNPTEPLTKGTKLCGAILLPPVGINSQFWSLQIDESKVINYYCVIPVFKEEMKHKLKYGSDSLIDKFDENDVSIVVDLQRKNTCKGSFKLFW